jgi:hypothetical protein
VKREEVASGVVLFLIGSVIALLSLKMRVGSFRAAGSGMFPLCLGLLLMGLSAAWLLKSLQKTDPGKTAPELAGAGAAKKVALYVGAIVVAILLLSRIGYPLFCATLLLALLRILGMKNWLHAGLLAVLTAVVSYMLFVRWLLIPLPKGWIGL